MTLDIFRCSDCAKVYATRGKLNRHLKTHSRPIQCEKCSRGFALRGDLQRHTKACHHIGNNQHSCPVDRCFFASTRKDNLKRHIKRYHVSTLLPDESDSSMVNATTTASLPQTVTLPLAVNNFHGIGSVSMFMQAATFGNIATLELLMNTRFTVEARAGDGSTALHCAARNGQAKTVQYLLNKGADVNAQNKSGRKPLHEGFLGNDLDTVKALTEHMTDAMHQNSPFLTRYYLAQTRNITILELYTQLSKPWSRIFSANGVFICAIYKKNDAILPALLKNPDFDVNGVENGWAPIHHAAENGNAKVLEFLLASSGIDKYLTIKNNLRNALHIAASKGHADIADQLLHHEIDVNSLDNNRRTPLQHAAGKGHLGVTKLLVEKWKADIASSDRYGLTPLHYAAFRGHWVCVHVLLEYIASKTNPEIVDSHLANREFVKKDVVTRLLNSAAFENPNIGYDRQRNTFLHGVVQKGDLEVIEILLAHDKIDLNATDFWGRTPLIVAVENRQIEAVRLLLQHPQIDINYKYGWRDTVLSYARCHGYQEIADLLLSHGAVDDDGGDAPTITTEDSSSLTIVKPGHMHDAPLQPQQEIDPEFTFDTFMEGIPALDDISDSEDEMMGQGFC